MKYLVLFGVLLVVYLLWRHDRRTQQQDKQAAAASAAARTPALPQDMVECPVCTVHLPRDEAIADARGRLYCCVEHRSKGTA